MKKKVRDKSCDHQDLPEKMVIGNYQTQKIIGKGSFGVIYQATLFGNDIENNFALKLEKNPKGTFSSQIQKEVCILKECKGLKGFATLYNYGIYNTSSYMVISLLGNNLNKTLHKSDGRFDQETTLRVAFQMIDRIAAFHQKGFVHRDIKPENFVLGINEDSKILYLIDFGLSKKYIENNKHIPMLSKKGFVGTARYASPNAHKGYEQGRRDDLIAIGYLIMYFLKGRLPWQGLVVNANDKKYDVIKKMKEALEYEIFFKDYDPVFLTYMQYVNNLFFDEDPDYDYIKDLFQKAFLKISIENKIKKKMPEPSMEETKQLKTEEDKEDSDLDNQILNHINEEIDNAEKNKIGGKFYSFKAYPSRTSTLRPNYDYSSCEIVEEEILQINKTYDFFHLKENLASKGSS